MKRSERGSNLVEFALVTFFILIPILAGATDLGRAFHDYIAIANASREGARYGSRFPALTTQIRATVKTEASGAGVNLADADITISFPDGPTSGKRIIVSINHSMPTIFGGILGVGAIPMTTKTEMIIYGPDIQGP